MATFKGQLETKTGTSTSDILYPKTSVDQVEGLPTPTSSDSGKVVGVNSSGQYVLVDGGGGGGDTPPTTPTDAVIFYSKYPFTIYMEYIYVSWDGAVYYSTNYSTWNTWYGEPISAVQSDGYYKLYLRGMNNSVFTGSGGEVMCFVGQAIKCCGNLNNLLDYTAEPTFDDYAFQFLFSGAGNVNFDVTLPSETLTYGCYMYMFQGCKSLTTAPALPATTLAESCYEGMFQNCASLTTAPSLPATSLAGYCYNTMFSDCSALLTAPSLPAMIMENFCYSSMFQGCKALTTPPSLPATTLAMGCYEAMFYGCLRLSSLTALPATTLGDSCYAGMFEDCIGICLSDTQTGEYQTPYRIPTTGTGIDSSGQATERMFEMTGGDFTETPSINTTYYTSNTIV